IKSSIYTVVFGVPLTGMTFLASLFPNALQYIMNEEGRLKIMSPVSASSPLGASGMIVNGNIQLVGGKWGVFEYFLKDHLGSTRMVITEEYHREIYKATMESAPEAEEERLFGKVDANGNPDPANEVELTRLDNTGGTVWGTNATAKISKLVTIGTTTTQSIGPNMLLKVMGGDLLTATAKYFYNVPTGNVNNNALLAPLVSSLLGGLSAGGVAPVIKEGAGTLQTIFNNTSTSPLLPFLNQRPSSPTDRPKAYLNYVFFDENFNPVPGTGGADLVNPGDNDGDVSAMYVKVPANGYAYVYLSNESDWPVYFDDFFVTHERGAIIEESHYYAFGLKMTGISAKAFNKPSTRYGFQGIYSEQDEETGYNEFKLRTYDPQISRWLQVDPYDEFANPYTGMGNNPINNVDIDGGGIFDGAGIYGFMAGAALGSISAAAIASNNGADSKQAFIAGAIGFFGGGAMGWGLSQVPWSELFNSKTVNFFVTGAKNTKDFLKEAPAADLLFARIKEFFSFGKLIVIQADNLTDASNKIDDKLKGSGKTIGSLILDSHGSKGNAKVEVGATILEAGKSFVTDNQECFDLLAKYTNVKTKVLLGSCWAGGCFNNGADLADKLSKGLNGATVYAGASVADSKTLWQSGDFSSVTTSRFGYGNNPTTQVNTGVWYKSVNGVGGYIGGYPRVGNAAKIIEKLRPFLTPVKFRKLEKKMEKIGPEETPIRLLLPPPSPIDDIGPPPEND
ncbi:MAG: RHS repeat-associated core domain-containing protein, partial [Niastella sp.]|nr:RHS repeat-associated core domain-containing protein [Niastella sp.]